jgi:hypothetical protein
MDTGPSRLELERRIRLADLAEPTGLVCMGKIPDGTRASHPVSLIVASDLMILPNRLAELGRPTGLVCMGNIAHGTRASHPI